MTLFDSHFSVKGGIVAWAMRRGELDDEGHWIAIPKKCSESDADQVCRMRLRLVFY
jgi:hypothetical protein